MFRGIKRPNEPWVGYGSLAIIAWGLFVLLLAVWSGPAFAAEFDSEKAASQWYESNKQCRQGEDAAGASVSVDQSDKECQRREVLTILLETHDFCWGASEQEWAACD